MISKLVAYHATTHTIILLTTTNPTPKKQHSEMRDSEAPKVKLGMPNTKANKTPPNPPKLIAIFLTVVGAPASSVIPPTRKRMAAASNNHLASGKMNAKNGIRLPPNPPSTMAALLHCDKNSFVSVLAMSRRKSTVMSKCSRREGGMREREISSTVTTPPSRTTTELFYGKQQTSRQSTGIFNITIHPQYYLHNNFAAAIKAIPIIPLSVFSLSSCSLLTQSKQIFKTNKSCCSLIKFFFQKELSLSTHHYIFLLLYC